MKIMTVRSDARESISAPRARRPARHDVPPSLSIRPGVGSCSWLAGVACLLIASAGVESAAAAQAAHRTHTPIVIKVRADQTYPAYDLNFDGAGTLTLIERETGAYAVATETSRDTFTWSPTRASGVRRVTGVSIGNFLDPNLPSLAVTSPEANRVNLLALDAGVASSPVPVPVYLPSLGPHLVAAVDIGGVGNTAGADLLIGSLWNGSGATSARHTLMRNSGGGSLTVLQDQPAAGPMFNPKEFTLDKSVPWVALGLIETGTVDRLIAYRFDSGSRVEALNVPGLPPGSEWDWGHFSASPHPQLIVYQPGGTNIRYSVVGPASGDGRYVIEQSGICLESRSAIQGVTVVVDSLGTRLLVVEAGGMQATVHQFAGVGRASLLETLTPPPGELFAAAIALGANGFFMVTTGNGPSGAEGIARHHVYRPQANGPNVTYQRISSGALPQFAPASGNANVFQYQREPFVDPAPNLLRSLHAGDWSSQFGLGGGPPVVSVQAETFVNTARGLDDPVPTPLGAPHPATAFGGVNQYTEFISLGTFTPAVGDQVSDVTISPPPGRYERSVNVRFSAADPAHQIFYRVNGAGGWVQFSGQPLVLFAESIVQYYGKPAAGLAKSPVKTARYEFAAPPGDGDSDRDGVPDYVESALGLDPTKGADSDGDGFSDKQELLEGWSPSDSTSHPAGQPGFAQHAAFDVVVTPRPLDGMTGQETSAAAGTWVRLYDLSGSLLGSTNVANPPASPTPASVVFRNIPIDARVPLMIVSTEPHFDVVTPGPDKRLGREMVGLVEAPVVPAIAVNYLYGSAGGSPAAEAAAWIAAAQAAQNGQGQTQPTETLSLRYNRISWVVLFERSLLDSLAGHGFPEGTNGTLFPFRPTDAGRVPLSTDLLTAAETPGRPALNPFAIVRHSDRSAAIFERLDDPQAQPFLELTRMVYEISSRSNHVAPGRYAAPFDYLRQFVKEGPLSAHELTHVVQQTRATLPDEALAAVNYILNGIAPRPLTNLVLRVRSDSFAGTCTTLETTGLPPTFVHLLDESGRPYQWPDAFGPVPGTEVQFIGYTDVVSPGCAGAALEVVQAGLVSIPPAPGGDANGNLLSDAWEKFFLGSVNGDPFADDDLDGYLNLQELYEGSDPKDPLAFPKVPPASLGPPVVHIEAPAAGVLQLEWTWPAAYATRVRFTILATSDLSLPFVPIPVTPVHLGDGRFRVVLPAPAEQGQGPAIYYEALARNEK